MHTFSIIIPVKPGGYVAACEHFRKVAPADHSYEILLAEGCAPSRQRNLAAQEASGDILYFLDDDSLIQPENFSICSTCMEDPAVAVVGGPSITPPEDSPLQQLFGYALSSPFGSGAVHNRYCASGETRETTDKELILCNLAVRRSVFHDFGGLNERLYPNEENEFMERLSAAGHKLVHAPAMSVCRSQRRTLSAFIRQMFAYGRGRGEQSLLMSSYPLASFVPLFFVFYLLFLPLGIKYLFLLAPLVIYLCLAFVSSLLVLCRIGKLSALLLPGIYLLIHVVNGIGLLWGLLHGKPEPVRDCAITIRRIKSFEESLCG